MSFKIERNNYKIAEAIKQKQKIMLIDLPDDFSQIDDYLDRVHTLYPDVEIKFAPGYGIMESMPLKIVLELKYVKEK